MFNRSEGKVDLSPMLLTKKGNSTLDTFGRCRPAASAAQQHTEHHPQHSTSHIAPLGVVTQNKNPNISDISGNSCIDKWKKIGKKTQIDKYSRQ